METESQYKICLEDFSVICRTCLNKENLKPLNEISHLDLLKTLTDIQVDNDELPSKICYNCVCNLEEVSTFIRVSRKNDYYLKEILHTSKTAHIKDDSEHSAFNCDSIDDHIDSEIGEEFVEENDIEKSSNSVEEKRMVKAAPKNLKSKSNKTQPINCNVCGSNFSTKKQLQEHQKINVACKIKQFKCNYCDKAFYSKFRLNTHIRTHTKETPYECKICLKKFRQAPNLKRHDDIIHKGLKPFKCEVCGKDFATFLRITEHLRIHTGERPHVCSYCGESFKKYSTRSAHEMRHKIKNGEIPKSDKNTKRYPRKLPSDPAELQCDVCSKTFSSKQAMLVHKQIHSGEKSFLCTVCGKGFMRKSHLEVHLRIHTGERPFECGDCGKRFRQAACFRNHLLIHRGERSFKCETCQRTFVQIGHLQSHIKTHTGEKPYKCTFCGKEFAQNGNLKAHTRTHTGERPYKCAVCFLGFHDAPGLRKHLKSHAVKLEDGVQNF